jgi:hypothetical protein
MPGKIAAAAANGTVTASAARPRVHLEIRFNSYLPATLPRRK